MQKINKKKLLKILPFLLSLLSIIACYFDQEFSFRFPILLLHLLAVGLGMFFVFKGRKLRFRFDFVLLVILLMSVFIHFLLIKNYPFVSIGDEIRDGGLDAAKIINQQRKNIFSYGNYESHGLIIPTFTAVFYLMFQESVLTYRVAAALIGILDVILVYLLVKKDNHKSIAALASLTLCLLPLHLFYARTEIVVIFSSFWMTLILLLVAEVLRREKIHLFYFAALILGFIANFHASIKTISFVSLLLLVLVGVKRVFEKNRGKFLIMFRQVATMLIVMLLSYALGFGPKLLFTPPRIFFQSRSSIVVNKKVSSFESLIKVAEELPEKYLKSFLVTVYEGTRSHYQNSTPILNPILGVFFVIGFAALIAYEKSFFSKLVLFYLLIIPFTNSAMTEALNNDHRLGPLYPVVAIVVAYGAKFIVSSVINNQESEGSSQAKTESYSANQQRNDTSLIGHKWWQKLFQTIVVSIFIISVTFSAYRFFYFQLANKSKRSIDYLVMHLFYTLQDSLRPKVDHVCLTGNQKIHDYLKLAHIRDTSDYLLPDLEISYQMDQTLSDYEVKVTQDCEKEAGDLVVVEIDCEQISSLECPPAGEVVNLLTSNHTMTFYICEECYFEE